MKFTLFHLMPYAALDLDAVKDYKTVWVGLPNKHYDKHEGHKLYQRYLDELVQGEALGFDGIAVNEHHSTAYGMMPSPIVTASCLAARTEKVKVAILGSAIPLRDHPLTLAEEHAMIDTISKGRLITGFVRGIGAEYHTWGTNPTFSHERFHEAHDLIIKAWTETEPFRWIGKHYRHEVVNVWPRPYQEPHPQVWIPSQGSRETIEWAAHPDRKYTYLQTFSPIKSVYKYLEQYRETCEGFGYTANDEQLGWAVPIYVSETDEKARAEAKVHFENFRNRFLKMPIEMLLPPGYTSLASMKGLSKVKAQVAGEITLELACDMGMFFCGSPETVRQQLEEAWKDLRFEHLLSMLQFGTLPADLTQKSMNLFATKVMPKLRETAEQTKVAVA